MRISHRVRAEIVGLTVLAVAGCAQQSLPEAAHTVSWYVGHKEEREGERKWCAEDAARQAQPNCINAEQAWHQVNLQPNAKSFADDLKFK